MGPGKYAESLKVKPSAARNLAYELNRKPELDKKGAELVIDGKRRSASRDTAAAKGARSTSADARQGARSKSPAPAQAPRSPSVDGGILGKQDDASVDQGQRRPSSAASFSNREIQDDAGVDQGQSRPASAASFDPENPARAMLEDSHGAPDNVGQVDLDALEKLKKVQDEFTKLEQTDANKTRLLSEATEKITSLEERLKMASQNVVTATDLVQREKDGRIEALKVLGDQHLKDIADLRTALTQEKDAELKTMRDQMEAGVAEATKNLEEQVNKVAALQQQLQAAASDTSGSVEIERLREEMRVAGEQANTKIKQVEEANKLQTIEIARIKGFFQDATVEKEKAIARLEQLQKMAKTAADGKAESLAEIDKLNGLLDANKTKHEDEMKDCEANLVEVTKINKTAIAKIAELEARLDNNADALAATVDSRITTLESTVAESKQTIELLRKELKTAKDSEQAVQRDLQEANKNQEALQKQLGEANQNQEALQKQLGEANQNREALQKQRGEANQDREALQKQLAEANLKAIPPPQASELDGLKKQLHASQAALEQQKHQANAELQNTKKTIARKD